MQRILYSDKRGRIFEDPGVAALAMKGARPFMPDRSELIELPPGSQLFTLPKRLAAGYDMVSYKPLVRSGRFAVAAFLAPGYTATYSPAYAEINKPERLPLFSYCAALSDKGRTYVTAIKVDSDRRHDSRFIDMSAVKNGARKIKKIFPKNKLVDHLKTCALSYGCPNAQNFFLSRYEAPLPTAPACNARCAGCISYQPAKDICETQPRIKFIPRPGEIAEIALYHIKNVRNAIVSFGQGCEGEPLTQARVIEESISLIRSLTSKATINLNTNGSRPKILVKLIDAGLDSVRISLNSVQPKYYKRYYRPVGYDFADVVNSIKIAKSKKIFVSINYLTMPGFTDTKSEYEALRRLISNTGVDMIQWRNLNYDPIAYFKLLKANPRAEDMLGIRQEMALLKKQFPRLRHGYFNPYQHSK